MYAGGAFLEAYAKGRANRELTRLLAHVPRTALRRRGSELEEVDFPEIAPGDVLPIDAVFVRLNPGAKPTIVHDELRSGRVMMVGDGIQRPRPLSAALGPPLRSLHSARWADRSRRANASRSAPLTSA